MTETSSRPALGGPLGNTVQSGQAALQAFADIIQRQHIDCDIETLVVELLANANRGVDGLDGATYAYLAKAGVSKARVKQLEAALVADPIVAEYLAGAPRTPAMETAEARREVLWEFFDIAGHPDTLLAACHWGDAGGLGWRERKRFVGAMRSSNFEAQRRAVTALMQAYHRANPDTTRAA